MAAGLKILFVTNNYTPYSGGVVSSIDTFRAELEAQGHTVYVVAPDFLGPQQPPEHHVIRLHSPVRFILQEKHIALPLTAYRQLDDIIAAHKPDIIHVHHPFFLGPAACSLAKKHTIPTVFTYHTMYEMYAHYTRMPAGLARYLITKKVKDFCHTVDSIIVPSAALEATVSGYGVTCPLARIPSPVSALFLENPERRQHNFPSTLLYVGRFAFEKNVTLLLDVAHQLSDQPYRLLLAGYGSETDYLQNYAYEKLRLNRDVVQFIVKPSKNELCSLYNQADIFLFPSKTDTQGIVLAEAMATGLPVIAIDGPGQRDIVRTEENGFIVSNQDEMVTVIRMLFERSNLLTSMSLNARTTSMKYTPRHCTEQLIQFYQKVRGSYMHINHIVLVAVVSCSLLNGMELGNVSKEEISQLRQQVASPSFVNQKVDTQKKMRQNSPVLLDPRLSESNKSAKQKAAERLLIARCTLRLPAEIQGIIAEYVVQHNNKIEYLLKTIPCKSSFFLGHHKTILSLAFSHDGKKIAATGMDGFVSVFNIKKNKFSVMLRGDGDNQRSISQVKFNARDSIVYGGDNKKLIEKNVTNNRNTAEKKFDQDILTIAYNPRDQNEFAVGGRGSKVLICYKDGKPEIEIPFQSWIHHIVYTHDGTKMIILLSGEGQKFVVYDVKEKKICSEVNVPEQKGILWIAAISSDNRYVAISTYSGYLHVYDLQNGTFPFSIQAHPSRCTDVKWFSQDNYILTTSAGTKNHKKSRTEVKVWDFKNKRFLRNINHVMLGKMWTLDVSPDQKYIACAGSDKKVSLYDMSGFQDVLSLSKKYSLAQILVVLAILDHRRPATVPAPMKKAFRLLSWPIKNYLNKKMRETAAIRRLKDKWSLNNSTHAKRYYF